MRVINATWQKCGTSSVETALNRCGLTVYRTGYKLNWEREGHLRALWTAAKTHDAVSDMPWPMLLPSYLARYPTAKIVLVERDADAFYRSALRQFAGTSSYVRRLAYGDRHGDPEGRRDIWLARYYEHLSAVKGFVAAHGLEDQFLHLRLDDTGKMRRLARFLGVDEPDGGFPHTNRGSTSPGATN